MTVVLVTMPPGVRTAELLRQAKALGATVVFAGDGVLCTLRSIPKPDVGTAFVELESLGAGMAHNGIEPVMRPRLLSILSDADGVLG